MYIFAIISKMEHFGEKCMRETMFKFCLMLKTSESPCIFFEILELSNSCFSEIVWKKQCSFRGRKQVVTNIVHINEIILCIWFISFRACFPLIFGIYDVFKNPHKIVKIYFISGVESRNSESTLLFCVYYSSTLQSC